MDDVLVIAPWHFNHNEALTTVSHLPTIIKFTIEEKKKDAILSFLKTRLHRKDEVWKFYRKRTNMDDSVHYLSAHAAQMKMGIFIGFFHRVLRISNQELLLQKKIYIEDTFLKLTYQFGFVKRSRQKAIQIKEH